MHNRDYYFIKPYDESLPKPPVEKFGEILKETYTQPFNWKGRTTRKSYWLSVIPNVILTIIALLFFGSAFLANNDYTTNSFIFDFLIGLIIYVYVFITSLGQLIRRLHDVDYSGYWYWVGLVPTIGAFFLLYLALQPSAQKPTRWGTYLFTDKEVYHEVKEVKVPEPSIRQILKEHFFDCFKWNARSTRTSYWVGTAVNNVLMVMIGLWFIGCAALLYIAAIGVNGSSDFSAFLVKFIFSGSMIAIAILIWLFLAQLGHTIRRLHDAGLNGAWYLISLIPVVIYYFYYVHFIFSYATYAAYGSSALLQNHLSSALRFIQIISLIINLIFSFMLFHPTTQNEVKWNGYLFEDKDTVDSDK